MHVWLMAARPKTLPASAAPILVGTAMAYADGGFHAASAAACFLTVLLLQIGTNFCNDYCDFQKGTDNEMRVGPTRVTQAGFVSPRVMGLAAAFMFAVAFLVSLYLIHRSGWAVAIIILSGIACGIFYTAGPFPLAYLGLGDVFVFIFFGPVAVAGTYLTQAGSWSIEALVMGVAPGLLAAGILVMNNLRDIENDAAAGKQTLAVRFGIGFSQRQYAFCLLVPLLLVASAVFYQQAHWGGLVVLVLSVPIFKAIKKVYQYQQPEELIPMLGETAGFLLKFSVLFSLGWSFS